VLQPQVQQLITEGKVENPHPYLRIWIGWKYWDRPEHPCLPWSGGWLDWDYEECEALKIIDELVEAEKRRQEFINYTKQQGPQNRY
jgi:hypothetical protein